MNKDKIKAMLSSKVAVGVITGVLVGAIAFGVGSSVGSSDQKQVDELLSKISILESNNKTLQAKVNEASPFFSMKENEKQTLLAEQKAAEEAKKKAEVDVKAEKERLGAKAELKGINEPEQINEIWEITPLSCEFQDYLMVSGGKEKVSTNDKFAVVEYKITNKSNEPQEYSFLETNRYIDMTNNANYVPNEDASFDLYQQKNIYDKRNDVIIGKYDSIINPGTSKNLFVAYEVPKNSDINNAVLGVNYNEGGVKSLWAVTK